MPRCPEVVWADDLPLEEAVPGEGPPRLGKVLAAPRHELCDQLASWTLGQVLLPQGHRTSCFSTKPASGDLPLPPASGACFLLPSGFHRHLVGSCKTTSFGQVPEPGSPYVRLEALAGHSASCTRGRGAHLPVSRVKGCGDPMRHCPGVVG